jgi:hypothetical protein
METPRRKKKGRPHLWAGEAKDVHVTLPAYLVDWAHAQEEKFSVVMRDALRAAYQRDQTARRRTRQADGPPLLPF